jgi:hypothetical protein
MKDKFEFIEKLLLEPKLNIQDKERVFKLIAPEMKNVSNIRTDLLNKFEELKNEIDEIKKFKPKTTNINFHNPSKVVNFLKLFGQETVFKYTTHSWDNPGSIYLYSIENFYHYLKESKKELNFFKEHIATYNLCNNFLYNEDIKNFWLYKNKKFTTGWQFFKQLQKDEKFNFNIKLDKNTIPNDKIDGVEVQTIQDVINIFRKCIQFKEDSLNKTIKDIFKDFESELNIADDMEPYINTESFQNLLKNIIAQFNERGLKKIIIKTTRSQHCLDLYITQLDSYSPKLLDLNNPNLFIGGNTSSIISNAYGLCDYSIISNFKIDKDISKSYELKILEDGITECELKKYYYKSLKTKINIIESDHFNGFTHKFKFYL